MTAARDSSFAILTKQRITPLIPNATIAGRALTIVIAIMTFLGGAAAGEATLIYGASREWRAAVSTEATIQVKPTAGRDIESDLRIAEKLAKETRGVAEARAMSQQETQRLLEPWLGQGADLRDLPVPRMVILKLGAATKADLEALRGKLTAQTLPAILDDHRIWSNRLAAMADVMVTVAVVFVFLIVSAMSLAVSFATRGAMAGGREIIEVLHFVGATDRYISQQFQRHFLWLGVRGASFGGGCAIALFFIAAYIRDSLAATPSGAQIEALFGAFEPGWLGYGAIAAVAVLSVWLCAQTSRYVVFRNLRSLA